MAAIRNLAMFVLAAAGCLASAAPTADITAEPVAPPAVTDAAGERAVRAYWTPERIASMDKDTAWEPTVIPPELRPIGAKYPAMGGAILTTADNKATVIAAAHCIHGGAEAVFYTGYNDNLLFIPGYRDVDAPHGNYTINDVVMSRAYARTHAQGRPAPETLGEGQRIPFGAEPAGYPRYVPSGNEMLPQRGQSAFRGERLAACYGDALPWPRGTEMTGLECVMCGGCSGGPAIQNFDEEARVGDVVAANNINDFRNREESRDGIFSGFVTDPRQ
ncbi:hypothetical protein DL769_005099 [Monosporascus sp. CRB-8-3]|nr:hypothetical protein DL769_005099 [Monosporascus sp. CRB-8-3]